MVTTALLVIIYLSFISLGLPDSMLGSAWPLMSGSLGAPLWSAGIVQMTISFCTIVSSLNSARLIRRFGTGKLTALSVLLTALSLLGFSFAKHYAFLIALGIPLGLGAGAVDAALNNYVALHCQPRHMSWLHCFWGVGTITGPMILSACLSAGASWRAGYWVIGLLQCLLCAVLLATLIAHFTGLTLDGFMGLAVAAFILVSGFGLVRDTIDPMLGSAVSREEVDQIRRKIMTYPGVLGTHDLMVHDYGPGREFASVHVEMSASEDPLVSHDIIDNIERDFLQEQNLHLVVHYDPVVTDDPRVPVMRAFIAELAAAIHPQMTIHDLRMVPGNTHTNVVFDCVVPYDLKMPEEEIRRRISDGVSAQYPNYFCVITTERSFISAAH